MISIHQQQDVIRRLREWAERRDAVRAMLMTSTRAVPGAPVDIFSDYDIVLVVRDIQPFVADRSWLQDFGEVLVVYWDPVYPAPDYGIDMVSNVTQYADGLKIDFTLWPIALFERIAAAPDLDPELDAGYVVLLDKDRLTDGLRPPSHRAYIPQRPTEEAFQTWVNDFFTDPPYVAKCLWRGELLPAKWCLDYDMKHVYLRQVLEWRAQIDHAWSAPVGSLGKGLKKLLPPEIWSELERTYVGAGIEENWEALFRTIALFRRVASDVARHLGYTYPHELDRRVTAYTEQIRSTPRAGERQPEGHA